MRKRRMSPSFLGDFIGNGFEGITRCNFSLYSDGSEIDFVDDPLLPATGWTKFSDELLTGTALPFNLGNNSSWVWETEIDVNNLSLNTDNLFRGTPTTGAQFNILYRGDDKWQVFINNDAGAGLVNYIAPQLVKDKVAILNITCVAGIITITWDGVSSTTVDITGESIAFTGFLYGGQGVSFRTLSFMASYLNFSLVDDWNFDIRLWEEADPKGNVFIGSVNGNELTLTDLTGAIYPNIGIWPTAYKLEDIFCVTGSPLTFGGEYMTSEGVLMTRGEYSVQYVKDVFI
jgi:hypothetical protein